MLKNKKKVVNEKVFKSKKPKKYAKNGRFFYPRRPIFKIIEASFSVLSQLKDKKTKNRRTFFFVNYTTAPRVIALGAPHIFG